jgi:Leucine-rich repeat (LRR) protein
MKQLDLSENDYPLIIPDTASHLTKLVLTRCYKIIRLPKCVDNISFSYYGSTMRCFYVYAGDSSSNIYLLEHESSPELEILRLENVKSLEEARSINLSEKQTIKELSLSWTVGANRSVDDMELLTALVPPTSLERFAIEGYCSVSFPDWVMSNTSNRFPNLVKMTLWGLPNCKSLPPLGQLPNLREVTLCRMESLEEWDTSYLSGEDTVNELKEVCIYSCPKLRIKPHLPRAASWLIEKSDNVLVPQRESLSHVDSLTAGYSAVPLHWWGFLHHILSLRQLSLYCCSDLTFSSDLTISPEISGVLHSLKSLNIDDRGHAELEELFGELTSLEELTIFYRELEELSNNMRHLTKLQSLSLRWCRSLRQLPQWLGELKSLKTLQVEGCRAIMTLPESIQELTNLKKLEISYCNSELKKWCNAEENKAKLAHIEHKVFALPYCLSYFYCSYFCTDNVFHAL